MQERQSALLFARNFFKHPRMLGSVIPSSPFLIDKALRHVDWSRARHLVEYGPGVGTLTRAMLERMRPDARLVAFETNDEFVRFLGDTLDDPRLRVVATSAAEVESTLAQLEFPSADHVVSGIPFSTIPVELQLAILGSTSRVLSNDGALLVYQFSRRVLPQLQRVFSRVECDRELRNVLPAWVFRCRK